MMKAISSIFFGTALLAMLCFGAAAQIPTAAPSGPVGNTVGAVEGIVVRAGTYEPISGATVELSPVGQTGSFVPGIFVVESGNDGRFQFRNIPAGAYRLGGGHAGFIRLDYGIRNSSGLLLPLNIEPLRTISDIQLALVPAAVISGRVFDSNGDPLVGARMQLFEPVYSNGVRSISAFSPSLPVLTDDLGNFRFFGLNPGTYYVGFRYSESGPVSITVYYPNTADVRAAQAIDLAAGRSVGNINVTAQTDALHHIRGRLSFDGGADVRLTSMNFASSLFTPLTAVTSTGPFSPSSTSLVAIDPDTGQFDIPAVPAGLYVLSAVSGSLFGRTIVDVRNIDVENVGIEIRPGIDIPVHVTLDPATTNPKDIDVSNLFFSVRPDPPVFGVPDSVYAAEKNESFTIQPSPGDYRILAKGIPKDAYIQSIRYGAVDVLNDGLLVDSFRPETVEIVIGSNPGTLDGVVLDNRRQPDANAMLVLAPNPSHRQRLDLYMNVYADTSGRFHLENIPPGDYSVFAWDNIEPLAWQNPEVLQKYESRGQSVHIGAGGKVNVQVAAIPVE